MHKPSFTRTPLAAGVALALGVAGTPVLAQDDSDEIIEEIVVSGIRGSLSSAQAMKENVPRITNRMMLVLLLLLSMYPSF